MVLVWREHGDRMRAAVKAARSTPEQREISRQVMERRWAREGERERAAVATRAFRARQRTIREMLARPQARTEPAGPVAAPSRERMMAGR